MFTLEILTAFLILIGALIMLLSVLSTRQVLELVARTRYSQNWRWLYVLMIFFAAGYIFSIAMVASGLTRVVVVLTGVIFLSGALFVFIVVRTGLLTIQDLQRSQRIIGQARDRAQEASRFKSEMLARVSHELMTPLNAILGYTGMLNEEVYGPLSGQQRQLVTRKMANTEQLIAEINELLEQSQLEAGQLRPRHAALSPQVLLDTVQGNIRSLAAEKDLQVFATVDPELPPLILGDQRLLKDILVNLAGNAVKFTEQGEVRIRLLRAGGNGQPQWMIQVSDTGPGIPQALREIIFEPFQQAEDATTRGKGGFGLGLAIAKQVTTLLGGEIRVDSMPGQGSTFTVTLPLAVPEAQENAN